MSKWRDFHQDLGQEGSGGLACPVVVWPVGSSAVGESSDSLDQRRAKLETECYGTACSVPAGGTEIIIECQSARSETLITAASGVRLGEARTRSSLIGRNAGKTIE